MHIFFLIFRLIHCTIIVIMIIIIIILISKCFFNVIIIEYMHCKGNNMPIYSVYVDSE